MSNKSPSRTGTVVGVVFSLLTLALAVWLVLNRQFALDQFNVWQYQPSASVATIAQRSGLSEKGEFYFYASRPEVNSATEFNANCKRQEVKSAILGCYSGGRIYIYDVASGKLDGIEEVTAAHETLHAIWERLDESDRASIGALLEAEYQKIGSLALKERMAYYDRNEPGEHLNELHSIIGTEVASIDPKLEAHYALYFSDRSKVVALHASYEKVFNDLQVQSDMLFVELTGLKAELEANTAQYNSDSASIERDLTALRGRGSSVDRTSQSQVDAYNAAIAAMRVRIDQSEVLRATINSQREIYYTKVAQYQQLIVYRNELTQSLDSTLAPAPSL